MHTTIDTANLRRIIIGIVLYIATLAAALLVAAEPSSAAGTATREHHPLTQANEPQAPTAVELAIAAADEAKRAEQAETTDDAPDQADLVLVARPVRGGSGFVATDKLSSGNQCPGSGALPEGATHHTLSGADVDADGDIDTLHGYVLDGQGYVQVSFTGGGGSSLAVDPSFAPMVAPRPSLGDDLDGDGREEFTARIGGGVGGFSHGLYQVEDCTLRAITLDGEPVVLHDRETIGNRSSFGCMDIDGTRHLRSWSLDLLGDDDLDIPEDGPVYGGLSHHYGLVDGELDLLGTYELYETNEVDPGANSSCSNLLPA